MHLAGVRAGGVGTDVDGQMVGDVERDRRLFDDFAASGPARIGAARGGRTAATAVPPR